MRRLKVEVAARAHPGSGGCASTAVPGYRQSRGFVAGFLFKHAARPQPVRVWADSKNRVPRVCARRVSSESCPVVTLDAVVARSVSPSRRMVAKRGRTMEAPRSRGRGPFLVKVRPSILSRYPTRGERSHFELSAIRAEHDRRCVRESSRGRRQRSAACQEPSNCRATVCM